VAIDVYVCVYVTIAMENTEFHAVLKRMKVGLIHYHGTKSTLHHELRKTSFRSVQFGSISERKTNE
jgi:hypothetical protein